MSIHCIYWKFVFAMLVLLILSFSINSVSCKKNDEVIVIYLPEDKEITINELEVKQFNASSSVILNYTWYVNNTCVQIDYNTTYSSYEFITNYTSAGYYIIKVTAFNETFNDSCKWNLTVLDINAPPVITYFQPIEENIELYEGNVLRFNVTAYDIDNDTLTYNWTLGDITVSNISEYIFETNETSANSYIITVNISDGNLTVSHYWNVTVLDNANPSIVGWYPVTDVSINETESVSFASTAIDTDNNTLYYRWYVNDELKQADEGNTSIYTFHTNYESAGFYIIKITYTDGSYPWNYIYHRWQIVVNNVNRVPEIIDYYPKDKNVSININKEITFKVNSIDADNDVLTYKWYVNDVIVAKNKDNYTFVADYSHVGVHTIKVEINDSNDTIFLEWNLTVIDIVKGEIELNNDLIITQTLILQNVILDGKNYNITILCGEFKAINSIINNTTIEIIKSVIIIEDSTIGVTINISESFITSKNSKFTIINAENTTGYFRDCTIQHYLNISSKSEIKLDNTIFPTKTTIITNSTLIVVWYLEVNVTHNNLPISYANISVGYDKNTTYNYILNGRQKFELSKNYTSITATIGIIDYNIIVGNYTKEGNLSKSTTLNISVEYFAIYTPLTCALYYDNVTIKQQTLEVIGNVEFYNSILNITKMNITGSLKFENTTFQTNTTIELWNSICEIIYTNVSAVNFTLNERSEIRYWNLSTVRVIWKNYVPGKYATVTIKNTTLYIEHTCIANVTGIATFNVIQKIEYHNATTYPEYIIIAEKSQIEHLKISTNIIETTLIILENYAPEINPTPSDAVIINETETITFYPNGTDADNDKLTYKWYLNDIIVWDKENYTFYANSTSGGNYTIYLEVNDTKEVVNWTWNLKVLTKDENATIIVYYPTVYNITITQDFILDFEVLIWDPDDSEQLVAWFVNETINRKNICSGKDANATKPVRFSFNASEYSEGYYIITLCADEDPETLVIWNITIVNVAKLSFQISNAETKFANLRANITNWTKEITNVTFVANISFENLTLLVQELTNWKNTLISLKDTFTALGNIEEAKNISNLITQIDILKDTIKSAYPGYLEYLEKLHKYEEMKLETEKLRVEKNAIEAKNVYLVVFGIIAGMLCGAFILLIILGKFPKIIKK